jgi:hypothetical protein
MTGMVGRAMIAPTRMIVMGMVIMMVAALHVPSLAFAGVTGDRCKAQSSRWYLIT